MMKKILAFFCAAVTICLVASPPGFAATLFSDNFDSGVSGSVWEVPTAGQAILFGDNSHAFGAQSARQESADPTVYNMRTKLGAFTNPGSITAGNKEVASVMFWDDLNHNGATDTTLIGGTLMLAKDGLSDFYQMGVNGAVSHTNYYIRTSLAGGSGSATTVARTQGWHELRIEALAYTGSGDVQFYIDNVNVGSGNRRPNTGSGFDLNEIRLGLSVKTPGSAFWYDNVSLDMVPEPASIGLLGLGGLAFAGYASRMRPNRRA